MTQRNDRRTTSDREGVSGLEMAPEAMLDLARQAAELLVNRIHNLPGEGAWDGEFREGLLAT
ncbi:MAG: hypothetical protein F4X96_08405, partial [Gammaproteobacteria bacterium]|nr:hypothetical protein [Gammaproteobacteria bacterium]